MPQIDWNNLNAPRLPIAVLIPVFNAVDDVRNLVHSLEDAFPEPVDHLKFIFGDDASTDKAIDSVWSSAFFSRPDVVLIRHEENSGFIKNVNALLEEVLLSENKVDVVLLNSDTLVFGDVFRRMQEEAYSAPNIATVTPLTNNGTIASLFAFPSGAHVPEQISGKVLDEVAAKSQWKTPLVGAPTGVGFCMFMRRDALTEMGLLSLEYGRGYGEECDWCQRGAEKGWLHIMSARAYVPHVGTKSFSETSKNESIIKNGKLLLSKFPEYDSDVVKYIAQNPLRFHRVALVLSAFRKRPDIQEVILFVLHADPGSPGAGGTERHFRRLETVLNQSHIAAIELFPVFNNRFMLRFRYREESLIEEIFTQDNLPSVLEILESFAETLHVQHLIFWGEAAQDLLVRSKFQKKILSIHEFFALCPSFNLIQAIGDKQFCGVEENLRQCNACFRVVTGKKDGSIQAYRERTLSWLLCFDRVLLPSQALAKYFAKAFGSRWSEVQSKVVVEGHDLSYIPAPTPAAQTTGSTTLPVVEKNKHIVFVGSIAQIKGFDLLLESLAPLEEEGFEVEVLGGIPYTRDKRAAELRVTHYNGIHELKALLTQKKPSLAVFASTTAESFCYSFFETLLLSPHTVPVVSPLGNPADVVRTYEMGVVMHELSSDQLVDACLEAHGQHAFYLAGKDRFTQACREDVGKASEAYIDWITERKRKLYHSSPTLISDQGKYAALANTEFLFHRIRIFHDELTAMHFRLSYRMAKGFNNLISKVPFIKKAFTTVVQLFLKSLRQVKNSLLLSAGENSR